MTKKEIKKKENMLNLAVSSVLGSSKVDAIRSTNYAQSIIDNQKLPKDLSDLIVKYSGLFQKGIFEGVSEVILPKEMGVILGTIIKTGSNFDRLNAIKILGQIVVRTSEKVANVFQQNVFMVPENRKEFKEITDTQIVNDVRLSH